jgi:hypothetical protein
MSALVPFTQMRTGTLTNEGVTSALPACSVTIPDGTSCDGT